MGERLDLWMPDLPGPVNQTRSVELPKLQRSQHILDERRWGRTRSPSAPWLDGTSPPGTIRGGSFFVGPLAMAASSVVSRVPFDIGSDDLGFRVASLPEPSTSLLMMAGMLGLAGLHLRRRRH